MKLAFNKTAQSLGLPEETLDRWIRQGRIPVQKQGVSCIFSRSTLEKWAAQRKLTLDLQDVTPQESERLEPGSLISAMKNGGFAFDLKCDDTSSALAAVVDQLAFVPKDINTTLLERLLEREGLSSTGIGKGVAIPHPRSPIDGAFETAAITTCFLQNPIDFDAIDDQPVFAMFLILSPDVKIHLHLLSRLAFCLRNDAFVTFLKNTPEPQHVLEKISEFEAQLDHKDGH